MIGLSIVDMLVLFKFNISLTPKIIMPLTSATAILGYVGVITDALYTEWEKTGAQSLTSIILIFTLARFSEDKRGFPRSVTLT